MIILNNKPKHLNRILFILITTLFSNNLFATNYYVSSSGNDGTTGTSPASAWATISKVNVTSLSPGDSVLFEAGGIWRETLDIFHSGAPGNFIVFARYGDGNNPSIFGSQKAENWTATGTANVWQTGTSLEDLSDEYYAGGIFFLFDDTIAWGNHRGYNAGFTNLAEEFDYTVNGTTHYVYSTIDPDNAYNAVEVTQEDRCIAIPDDEPASYVEFNGIDFKFARLAGFDAGYPAVRGATDLVFRNCTIGYVGIRASGYAYGIAAWHSNFLVENCIITDCGRRGISVNLYLQVAGGEQRNLNNIIIRKNVFKRGYHTTALDLSSQQTSTDTIQNVYFYNNYVDDSDFQVICDNCGSNQVFFQDGTGSSLVNNIYVEGNIFVQSTARNILFEGVDTSYVWNNTIIGHNPNITENPYNNVGWNSDGAISYYQNNILYDNLPDNSLQNHGVFIYDAYTGVFAEKDYNLYHSLFPKLDRNISAHRVNSIGGMGYWRSTEWNDYITENTLFEQNSPEPGNPNFIDYDHKDYRLTDASPAVSAGTYLTKIITDPFGKVDTIGKYDITGKPRIVENPSIGAHEYQNPDSNGTDIIYFVLAEQKEPAIIDLADHTVDIVIVHGTDITNLSPTITVSYGATINPASGVSRDFSSPQIYMVYSLKGTTQQEWTVTITIAESSETNILDFSIPNQTSSTIINYENHTISLEVDPLTDLTNLTPTISISEEATITPASGVPRDFTSPVNYTVFAQDGTQQNWLVTITNELSSDAEILAFSLPEQTGPATIQTSNHTVTIEVAALTNLTNLTPTISISEGATITPASGVSRDFTSPVNYTVFAQDGTQQNWLVTVTAESSSDTEILTFSFPEQTGPATIQASNHTIAIEVTALTILTNLTPTISISEQATISPGSGVSRDFTSPVNYTVTAQDGTQQNWLVTVTAELSSETEILAFSFPEQTGPATIQASNHTIAIEVTALTNLTNLTPTISISEGATITPASGVSRDFTSPVNYTVTAQDGTQQNWLVTVTVRAELSSEAEILAFSFPEQTGPATIQTTNHTIAIEVTALTNLTNLTPTISISDKATITPASGVSRDFTSPVDYTVTAQDGTQQYWLVTVTVSAELSSEAEILTFSLPEQTGPAIILTSNHTISIEVTTLTNLTNLTPTISISDKATITPASGVSRDFTSSVNYTVTAQDGTQQNWLVTVTVSAELSSEAEILAFSFPEQTGPGTIQTSNHTIAIEVTALTNLTNLTPTISISEQATITPGSGVSRDFTSPVNYTVTAQDETSQKIWEVTVTVEGHTGIKIADTKCTFTLYPNPAENICRIKIGGPISGTYSVQLFNLQGKKVYQSIDISENEHILQIDNLKSGLYILQIAFKKSELVLKDLLIIK